MNGNSKVEKENSKVNITKSWMLWKYVQLFCSIKHQSFSSSSNGKFVYKKIQVSIYSISVLIQLVVVLNWMNQIRHWHSLWSFSIRNTDKQIISKNFMRIQGNILLYFIDKYSSGRLIDQLTAIFESRAPWDEEGKYTLDSIAVSLSNWFSQSKSNLFSRSTMRIVINMN